MHAADVTGAAARRRMGTLVWSMLVALIAVRPADAQAQTQDPVVPSAAVFAGPVAVPAGITTARSAATSRSVVIGGQGAATAAGVSLALPVPVPRSDWWAPVASAVLPGAGQARLGQDRFVGYMAVEGYLWIRYLADRRAGTDARNAYRDMALRVSRAGFPGPKPQGNFEYYERMEHWIASGVYDGDPGAGFAPETDTTTFNGKMWSIARTTYWSDPRTPPPVGSPAYEAALRFYRQNAVTPEFQWSWRSAPLHQDVYRRSVRASNDGFRHAVQDIGAVIANHVLSTVDAYISLRLRLGESTDTGTSSVGIGATLPFETIDRIVNRTPRNDRTQ